MIAMKRLLVCTGLLIAATTLFAQQGPPKSPPETESATIGGATITISYSSPRVNGRAGHIFTKDGLISHNPHYPVWRAGANSATKLHTDADLDIGGISVPKGDYTLFVDISDPDNWELIASVGLWATAEPARWAERLAPYRELGNNSVPESPSQNGAVGRVRRMIPGYKVSKHLPRNKHATTIERLC